MPIGMDERASRYGFKCDEIWHFCEFRPPSVETCSHVSPRITVPCPIASGRQDKDEFIHRVVCTDEDFVGLC